MRPERAGRTRATTGAWCSASCLFVFVDSREPEKRKWVDGFGGAGGLGMVIWMAPESGRFTEGVCLEYVVEN